MMDFLDRVLAVIGLRRIANQDDTAANYDAHRNDEVEDNCHVDIPGILDYSELP